MPQWYRAALLLLLLILRPAGAEHTHDVTGSPAGDVTGSRAGDVTISRQYCVVGAGPAGLQMGLFLKEAGRDYVLLERNDAPGSFFERYPRHRTLISINKRHTGKVNREFNERHDWNSLLTDDPALQFGRFSADFFPQADAMVQYLGEFQRRSNITVHFGVNVTRIERRQRLRPFILHTSSALQYRCSYVIVATGMWQVNKPPIGGQELIQHYDDVPVNAERFRGKNVLILGRGNAAFETASNISGHTNLIHMVARNRARLAWSTHYVGDLRAINNNLLDTYQLKSLDGLLETDLQEIRLVRHKGRIHVRPADGGGAAPRPPQTRTVHRTFVTSLNATANEEGSCGSRWGFCSLRPEEEVPETEQGERAAPEERGERDAPEEQQGRSAPEPQEVQDNFSMRDGYDEVIGCLGFKFDFSIFDSSTDPGAPGAHPKFPSVKSDWGSPTTPGLYFAGVASHALDFRRSAGGFVHGFRYTARALHRILEWRNHRSAWPATSWPLSELLNVMVRRLNTAAGPYQMFSVLCDIIVFQSGREGFLLVPEFPVAMLHRFTETTGHRADQLLVMSLEYGEEFSGPDQDTFRWDRAISDPLHAEKSNFLHPVVYFYQHPPSESAMLLRPSGRSLPAASRVHHILEDFLTDWTAPTSHLLPLRRFLEACLHRDLRHYSRSSCLRHALTNRQRPLFCS